MIEINNLTSEKIKKSFVEKVAKIVLEGEKAKGDISLALVDVKTIKELNRKYRKKNKPTDVLSFQEKPESITFTEKEKPKPQIKKLLKEMGLGEIVICPPIVKKNAKKFGLKYNEELARVLIHGILHISGYDHEKKGKRAKKMEKKEEYYLTKVSAKNIR